MNIDATFWVAISFFRISDLKTVIPLDKYNYKAFL